ncbi:hypothetical protein C2845_PM11G02610 [Panicum miliaceum]|uniref:Uncharacterized protein n=1 Tax=Panicum miliaceum TaxID=4540 RepID=A0A3L6RNC8_PANMI|nr:hypothetical protein C2845_PM11G02610 [Panicum miliaceum]
MISSMVLRSLHAQGHRVQIGLLYDSSAIGNSFIAKSLKLLNHLCRESCGAISSCDQKLKSLNAEKKSYQNASRSMMYDGHKVCDEVIFDIILVH